MKWKQNPSDNKDVSDQTKGVFKLGSFDLSFANLPEFGKNLLLQ
jgi:hypothetical protein